jgi:hypothetical protein
MQKRHTPEDMLRHRKAQGTSGLTIEDYCKREGISPTSWWYWRKRLLSRTSTISSRTDSAAPFLQLTPKIAETQRMEIALPNDSRITIPLGCDPDFLHKTIRMLSGLRPR